MSCYLLVLGCAALQQYNGLSGEVKKRPKIVAFGFLFCPSVRQSAKIKVNPDSLVLVAGCAMPAEQRFFAVAALISIVSDATFTT